MRPPVCEICDADVDPAGGLVTFQPDDRSREWRRRAEAEPGFVGHPPDTGWFCSAHIDDARDVARSASFDEGVRRVRALSRAVDVTTLTFPDPPGLPAAEVIPARSPDGVRLVLRRHRDHLIAALGAEHAPTVASTSFRLDDTHDRTVTRATAGAADLFDRVEYERVDGALVTRLIEMRVERDGQLLALLRVGSDDRLQRWVGDERLRAWSDAVAADLATAPPDLLDPSPDLVGVDLGAGRLGAHDGFELRWVEWDVAEVEAHALAQSLRDALPAFFAALQLGAAPAIESRTQRTWDPIDGAQPPYCPFTDTTVHTGERDGTTVELRVVLTHWDEDAVANVSVSMSVGAHLSIGAFGANGGRTISTLRLDRPTTAAVVDVVDRLIVDQRT